VITAILVFVFAAVLIGTAFALGGVVLPILLVLAGLAVLGWFVLAGVSRRPPSEVADRAHEQELLGPGGPDDPRA
jgi:hypothetical protein